MTTIATAAAHAAIKDDGATTAAIVAASPKLSAGRLTPRPEAASALMAEAQEWAKVVGKPVDDGAAEVADWLARVGADRPTLGLLVGRGAHIQDGQPDDRLPGWRLRYVMYRNEDWGSPSCAYREWLTEPGSTAVVAPDGEVYACPSDWDWAKFSDAIWAATEAAYWSAAREAWSATEAAKASRREAAVARINAALVTLEAEGWEVHADSRRLVIRKGAVASALSHTRHLTGQGALAHRALALCDEWPDEDGLLDAIAEIIGID